MFISEWRVLMVEESEFLEKTSEQETEYLEKTSEQERTVHGENI